MILRVFVGAVLVVGVISCSHPEHDSSPSVAEITCQHVLERPRHVPRAIEDNIGDCRVDKHKVIVTMNPTVNPTSLDDIQLRFSTLVDAQESARANLNDIKAIVVLVTPNGGISMSSNEVTDPVTGE